MALFMVTVSASGDNPVVAAVTGKKIRVKSFQLVNGANTANSVKWRSGTADISGVATAPAAFGPFGVVPPSDPKAFLMETVAGQALNLNLSAATAVLAVGEYTLE
jgi:hypothetical protein